MGNITQTILNKDNSLYLEIGENTTMSPITLQISKPTTIHVGQQKRDTVTPTDKIKYVSKKELDNIFKS